MRMLLTNSSLAQALPRPVRGSVQRGSPLGWLARAAAVRAQRRALRRLDPARLADIGVSRIAAWDEGNRPFWDMP